MKPITTQYHYNKVRNAYYGPESWYEYTSKPWVTLIDQGYKGKIPLATSGSNPGFILSRMYMLIGLYFLG